MHPKYLAVPLMACGLTTSLLADFTYNSTSQMTGGALLKMMSVFAGKMKDPIPGTVSVKGSRMVHKTGNSSQIIDLDKETITRVNYDKKTYSIITFAQMKEALQNMSDKVSSKTGDTQTDFKVSVNETGQTRNISGYDAKGMVMKIEMTAASTKDQSSGAITVNSDMWLASDVPGYGEMREFQKRMAEKLDWTPGSSPLAGRADIAKGMGEMYKQTAKMNGMPVLQVMKMGAAGMADAGSRSGGDSSNANRPPPTTPSDALASALGGRFGMGRKKNTDSSQTASNSGTPSSSDSLIEMTIQVNSVSNSVADPALFQVPAGFKEIQEDALPKTRGR